MPNICEVSHKRYGHVNKVGVVVHGIYEYDACLHFSGHVFHEIGKWIEDKLQLGFNINQVMLKHLTKLKHIMKMGKELHRDVFLDERDIMDCAGKLANEIYCKHANNV